MKLTPARANSVGVLGYKFRIGEWTEVDDEHLDYLLSPYCPYVMMENEFSGPYWVRNDGTKRTFRYWEHGKEKHIRIAPGETVPLDRHVAYQVIRATDISRSCLRDVVSPGARVLVVRYGGLGDVLLSLPAVRSAVDELGVIVHYSTDDKLVRLVQHNEYITGVFGYGGYDGSEYDAIVDLRRFVEAEKDSDRVHRTDLFARSLGVDVAGYKMDYTVVDEERENIDTMVPRDYVVVQASGSIPRRTLPPEKTVELVAALVSLGYHPVVVDNIRDPVFDVPGCINLTGKLSIGQLFAVLERADCVVAGDSGVMHAAVAVGTPTIGLFGAVKPELRVKDQPHCKVLEAQTWSGCAPCNDGQERQCGADHLCLNAIPVERIIEEVQAVGDH